MSPTKVSPAMDKNDTFIPWTLALIGSVIPELALALLINVTIIDVPIEPATCLSVLIAVYACNPNYSIYYLFPPNLVTFYSFPEASFNSTTYL